MRTFLRRIFLLALAVAVVAAAGGFLVRHRMLARPHWYVRQAMNPEMEQAAANSAVQKLGATYSAAHRAQAEETRAALADNPTTQQIIPAAPITLELNQDEMNAFFTTWEKQQKWKERIGQHFEDPIIVLDDHELILAATVKDWDTVLSLHFTPQLANGKLNMTLSSVMAGTLPMPKAAYAGYADKLVAGVEWKLPTLRREAEIEPRGWANAAAVSAAMSELLIHALRDEPAEPVLFVPEGIGHGHMRSLPVRILSIDIANKVLTLKVQPMNADQRDALLQHLRAHEEPQTALGKPGAPAKAPG